MGVHGVNEKMRALGEVDSTSLLCAFDGQLEDVLRKSKSMSIGFLVTPTSRMKSVRLRQRGRLLDSDLLCSDRDAPVVRNQMSMISQFLCAISQNSELKNCGGVEVDSTKTFDGAPSKSSK